MNDKGASASPGARQTVAPPAPPTEPPEASDRAGGGFRRAAVITYASTATILSLNLVAGVVVARALGAEGRGALAAIITSPHVIAWVVAFGAFHAVAYHQARHPADAPTLLATWAALLAPLAIIGIAAGELLIPTLLSAQTAHTVELARLYMLVIVAVLALETFNGLLLGDHDFGFYNLVRTIQPLALATAYVALWALGHLTVGLAVLSNGVITALLALAVGQRVLRRHGFGRPSARLARTTFWYGARAHGDTVGALANGRLDLLILPAFLAAASVGLYSVAVNVSYIVATICGSLAVIVMPAASRRGPEGTRTVLASLQATLVIGVALAALLAVVAGPAVRLVYGSDFAESVTPLRLLLPGTVLLAGAWVLAAGLYALNRPFTAFLAQLAGVAVTVPGLILFLERGGIEAAAIVSTISYTIVFMGMLLMYRRAAGVSWRDVVSGWSSVAGLIRMRLRRAA